LINNKKNKTLFEQLLSQVPSEIKRFVRKQGEVAVQIAKILKNKGITQKEFAKKLNMKESQLSKILAGNANCTLKTIAKIENVLNEDIITIPMFRKEFTHNVTFEISYSLFKDSSYNDTENFIDYPLGTLLTKQYDKDFSWYNNPMCAEA
jgi:transcriptional regulator with XRE-family HTH domain